MKTTITVVLFTSLFAFGCHSAPTPREAVQQLQELRYPKQIAEAQTLCTDVGWPIVVRMTANSHEFLRNFAIGEIKSNPHLTDVQLVRDTVEGKSVLWVRLVETEGNWKLKNIFIRKFNNVDVNLWVRFIYQHPEALEKRFSPVSAASGDNNLQKFNEATTAIQNVLNIIKTLKDLSDHGRN